MTNIQFKTDILSIQNKLYKYALSIVFDVELAKDIVQEVLLKLWDQREMLHTISNIEAWCIRVTRNAAYDKLKRSNRRTEPLEMAAQQFVAASSPDKAAEDADLIQVIRKIMQDLPEQQKEIFRLRELLGYDNQEIEEIMGLNRPQVKVNLFRARQKIKSKLLQLINYGLEE